MKINCIIQARMGSTRLPGKVLEKIGDKTLLGMVIDRCHMAQNIDKVVVAFHGFDVQGHKWGEQETHWTIGPEEPAARFVKVLAEHPCDGFVRVCADSPFIDAAQIDIAAEGISNGGVACSRSHGIHGNQAEGFDTETFLNIEPSMQGEEREHLGLYFERRDRLTVDTPGDLERARLIVSRMTKPHTEYTATECLDLLRK